MPCHWRGWDTGLLAKLQLKEEKEATKVVEDKVKGGAMAWRRKAAESKAEKEAAAAAAEQQAKNQALFTATVKGNVEDVTRLLAEGAEVDAVNGAGQTVTQLAEERERPAVIKAVVAHISDSLFTAVMDVWAAFTAYEKAEEESGGAEATQPSPSPRATTPGGTPLGTALPENSEVSAVIKEDRALQDAIGRAQPVLDAIVGLEALLTEKAARESSAAIHKEVLKKNKKKLAVLKKFKRRMHALENRRKEKEAKWRAEVNRFKEAAKLAELRKAAREVEKQEAAKAEAAKLAKLERMRMAREVEEQRRRLEIVALREAAIERERARNDARRRLDCGPESPVEGLGLGGAPPASPSGSLAPLSPSPLTPSAASPKRSPLAAAARRRRHSQMRKWSRDRKQQAQQTYE